MFKYSSIQFVTTNPIKGINLATYLNPQMRYCLFLFLGLFVFKTNGQINNNDLVQFSGIIVTADSLKPIPFSSIMIRNTNHGTISDYYGFFSFVAKMKDTIEFMSIGYKKGVFIIPDTLTDNRCSMIQILRPDTVMLKEIVIFPWPTKEQFKDAFVRLRVPDDDLTKAQHNLDPDQLTFLAATMPMNGSENFRNQMNEYTTKLYYNGQVQPNNLMNPIAWAQFIKMWQNGVYKKKEKKYKEE
jgi:hypothetical protein